MKYSVIIPLYNKANTVSKAIDSIKSQQYDDYEIIVVNDGSKDNPHKILDLYEDVIVIDKTNGGVSSARNVGLDVSKGDYICFLDADDLWLPNHFYELNKMIAMYPNSGVFITSHLEELNGILKDSSKAYPSILPEIFETDNYFRLLNEYGDGIIHTNSVCIEKKIIDKYHLKFDEKSKLGEDVDMWFRAALRCNVTVSKKATTSYQRDLSTATKNGEFNDRWIFSMRNDDIKKDENIPLPKKKDCLIMIDRNRLYTCRQYLKMGNREAAKKILQTINYRCGKNYNITRLLVLLPMSIVNFILNFR